MSDLEEEVEDISNDADKAKAAEAAEAAEDAEAKVDEAESKAADDGGGEKKAENTDASKKAKKQKAPEQKSKVFFCCLGGGADSVKEKKKQDPGSGDGAKYTGLPYVVGEWKDLPTDALAQQIVEALLSLPGYSLGYLTAPSFVPIKTVDEEEGEDEDEEAEAEEPVGGMPSTTEADGTEEAAKEADEAANGSGAAESATTKITFELLLENNEDEETLQKGIFNHVKGVVADLALPVNSLTITKSVVGFAEEMRSTCGFVVTKEDLEDLAALKFVEDKESPDTLLKRLAEKDGAVEEMLKKVCGVVEETEDGDLTDAEKKNATSGNEWFEDAKKDKRLIGDLKKSIFGSANAFLVKVKDTEEELWCVHFRHLVECYAMSQSSKALSRSQKRAKQSKFMKRAVEPNWIGAEQTELWITEGLFVPEAHMRKLREVFFAEKLEEPPPEGQEAKEGESLNPNPSVDKTGFIRLMTKCAPKDGAPESASVEALFAEWGEGDQMDLKSFYKFYACVRSGASRLSAEKVEAAKAARVFCEILRKPDPGPQDEPGYADRMTAEEITTLQSYFDSAGPKPKQYFLDKKKDPDDEEEEKPPEDTTPVLDKEDFFILIKKLGEDGVVKDLPPVREQSGLYTEADQDEDGCIDFPELANLYIKIRDGTLPKSAGMFGQFMRRFSSSKSVNWDNESMEDRYRKKYGAQYIFADEVETEIPPILEKFREAAGEDQKMDGDECVALLQFLFDGKARYFNAGDGGIPTEEGNKATDEKKLRKAFARKNRRLDLPKGEVKEGDFFELFVETHMGNYDKYGTIKKPKEEQAKKEEPSEEKEEEPAPDAPAAAAANSAAATAEEPTAEEKDAEEENEADAPTAVEAGKMEEKAQEPTEVESVPEPATDEEAQKEEVKEAELDDKDEEELQELKENQRSENRNKGLPLALLPKVKQERASLDGHCYDIHSPPIELFHEGAGPPVAAGEVPAWALGPSKPPPASDIARQIKRSTGLKSLVLDFTSMNNRSIQSIGRALLNSGNLDLEHISFKACGLSALEVGAVMRIVEEQPKVMHINLSDNAIGPSALKRLARGLSKVSNASGSFRLDLSRNMLVRGADYVGNVSGVVDLISALKSMPGRKHVTLAGCGLEGEIKGVVLSKLQEFLQEGTAELDVRENGILSYEIDPLGKTKEFVVFE
jgi:hypothetical protein